MQMASFLAWCRWLMGAWALALCAVGAQAAALPGPLVDVGWLQAHLAEVTVLDVRGAAKTLTTLAQFKDKALIGVGGHIPGARFVEFGHLRKPRDFKGETIDYMPPTAAQMQALLRAAGVNGSQPIVITGDADSVISLDMAAWLYWCLKAYGGDEVAILNGGTAAWIEAGQAVSTDPIAPVAGKWTAVHADDAHWLVGTQETAAARSKGIQVVDARAKTAYQQGHIEGALSFPTDAIVRKQGLATFYLDQAGYEKLLPTLNVDAAKPTIVYCQSGLLSAGAWFVLHELMGNDSAHWYVGSMQQWLKMKQPVVLGEP